MADNKLIIGNGKGKNKKENDLVSRDPNARIGIPDIDNGLDYNPVQESLDENIWGNDRTLLDILNEEQLAERRLYTRVKYMQRVECMAILEDLESTPDLLTKPIAFMVVDVSMGGIGVVSEFDLQIGRILIFNFSLDKIVYEIKCKVIYNFQNDGKFRAGLKLVEKDKEFIRHLKIFVARLSLQSKYGTNQDYKGVS